MNAPLSRATVEGMRSDYADHALAQRHAVARGLERAATQLIAPLAERKGPRAPLHFIDLGAADGVNAFPVVRRFAEALGPHDTANPRDLLVSHLDVPEADFCALTRNLQGHPDSYRRSLAEVAGLQVQTALLPCSYYDAYLPAASADVVFATISLHYASRCHTLRRSEASVRACM